MTNIDDIIELIKSLGVFTYEQLEKALELLPNSKETTNEIQEVLDRLPIKQVFEYYRYIGY